MDDDNTQQADKQTPEPEKDDLERNLPGTPDQDEEGLVDGVAEGE